MTTTAPRPRWLLPTMVGYRRAWLGSDLLAGLSAGAVVVPQAMAYATIANLPVQVGLYTCIVPMFVYALLGGSRAMSVSTTSTIATLTATTLVSAGVASGSKDPLGSLMMLTLLVGACLALGRLFRLGSLVENISGATALGLKIGVGATVAVGQVPKLLGETTDVSGEGFIAAVLAVGGAWHSVNWPTVALSAASILVLVLLRRFAPLVPGALIVAAGGILLVAFGDATAAGIALIDPVPSGLPLPGIPDFTHILALVPGALAIAVMAFLESAAVARGIRRKGEPQIDSDQELFAVAGANVAGAFFATMPAAGGFSQSAMNQGAGAKTQVSTLVTVALAVVVAVFLGPVLSLLPEATLAAMVFVAVAGLINVPQLVRWARISPMDFWVAFAVALIALTAGLLPALAVGVVVTLILVLREVNTPELSIVGRVAGAMAIHLGRGMYTANAQPNERAILSLAVSQHPPVSCVILDVERLTVLSMTVLDTLEDLDSELGERGIVLRLARLPEAATKVARKTPWYAGLEGQGRVHHTVEEGLAAAAADHGGVRATADGG
ncbi:SulP family inorganic anion transporter [Microbacterium sp. HD4P20]|uniref:SulP family inorganic anion transporter n=1 Tax=Microbacterium sp. HD4P20 TaxID=2864874 RepID=UPI0020A467F2|nr:SulP family inorganic anion transporter [Microbacterium sp. HD4P20]MCP2635563.1 SulP family inorganic anion transporter [Microbacterium sp. HD4P20]